jgi:hypothetical protein
MIAAKIRRVLGTITIRRYALDSSLILAHYGQSWPDLIAKSNIGMPDRVVVPSILDLGICRSTTSDLCFRR